jgi:hypothetical protein
MSYNMGGGGGWVISRLVNFAVDAKEMHFPERNECQAVVLYVAFR